MNWLPSEWRPERLSPSARVGFRHLLPIDVPVVAKLSSVSFPLNYPEYWFHNFCFNAKDEFCAIGCFVEEHLAGFIVVVRDHISYELVHRTTEFERNLAIEADGKLAYVMSLAVDFRFQRLGIGSEMMRVAIANCLCHQLKPKMIYLHVMHDNVGAQKMYSKMGFQHRHTNPRYYYIDRREKAGFILVKDLGAYDSDCAKNKEHLLASDVLAVKKLSKATFESTDDPDWWYEGFCTNRDDDYCAVGCFVDQQLMGYVAISLDYYRKELEKKSTEFEDQLLVEADKKLANVESLVVSRHHQRTGIGSELLRLAIHSCLNHKLTPKIIYLYVDHRNTGAQKLYEKMGFMNRHTEPRYYYDVSGKFQPGFVFVKIL
ncbi:hypothetical protein L596_009468 [Steinernema carpocapsae]|uniref:N-alpha-acetyltransferase 60 n=2 Tax=Steinernema carpocapsae TaxID=34508 RepID=A0A4U5PFF6_STECR|nr:hypothetical protein L596_009468 [Steinernema carpocapsae]